MATITELEATIDTRHAQLTRLLELTAEQEVAIAHSHMNELMRVLADKQRLIEQFVALSDRFLRDYESFPTRPQVSSVHRVKNEECNTMHRELMAREAACQETLTTNRDQIGEELARGEGARRAADGYGKTAGKSRPQGGGLDLSSD
jgi:hypothetical protein